jgi:GNAT superfamily N-acetyltransferase
MSEQRFWGGTIRKLWPTETDKFRYHLLRLDKQTRRLRFAHGVSDAFVEDYANHMSDMGAIVYGYFVDGEMRGAAELRKLGDVWGQEAEAAFSVEKPFQEKGIGSELMGRVIRSARNRGVHLLYMSCLAENAKMQSVARKHEAGLRFEYGEVVGEIIPEDASYFSFLAEAMEDRVGYMMAVLDLQSRLAKPQAA